MDRTARDGPRAGAVPAHPRRIRRPDRGGARAARAVERAGVGIIMADPSWVGGVTVARKVADLAALHLRPFTPHDCTGPITLAVGVHLCLNAENALLQEMVRAFYFGWYDELVSGQPVFEAGRLRPAAAPGHGVAIRDEVRSWEDLEVRSSPHRG